MIEIKNLTKLFQGQSGNTLALDNVDLDVHRGEFFVLLGPSGSGKTTLLRSVAGLERPDSGEIRLDSALVYSGSKKVFLPPDQRKIGMVFQSYAIWPHMTVFGNVALPLTEGRAKIARDQVDTRVSWALELVGLAGLEQRPAPLLSGGQQQRVALARALAVQPNIMLMDEPLSNLDARLREEVRREIKTLTMKMGVTTLYVTHDQGEAMELADRIAVMDKGRILQIGSPEDLYQHPAHPRVAQFLGSANWYSGSLISESLVKTSLGELKLERDHGLRSPADGAVTVAIRPEGVRLFPPGADVSAEDNVMSGEIEAQAYFGDHRLYTVRIGEDRMLVKLPFDQLFSGPVAVSVPRGNLRLFGATSDFSIQQVRPGAM